MNTDENGKKNRVILVVQGVSEARAVQMTKIKGKMINIFLNYSKLYIDIIRYIFKILVLYYSKIRANVFFILIYIYMS